MLPVILTCLTFTLHSRSLRLPVENTLSNPFINDMVEDEDGYIWIATRVGLNRFNGSTYKIFYQSDSLSLANDFVTSMCVDRQGQIWLGTSTGVSLVRDGAVVPEHTLNCGAVFDVVSYDKDRLLVLVRNNLYILDKNSLAMTLIHQDESLTTGRIVVTAEGMVWIYDVTNPVINILDRDFSLVKTLSTGGRRINAVSATLSDKVLVATSAGLDCYDPQGNPYPISDELKDRIGNSPVLSLSMNKQGRMCAAVKGKGLYIFTGTGNDIHKVWNDENLESESSVSILLTENNVFISKGQGLEYRYFSSDKTLLPVSFTEMETLNMFYPMSDDRVFVLTNKDAYMMKVGSEEVEKFRIDGKSPKSLLTISLFDADSCLWVLHDSRRLCRYEFGKDRLRLLSEYEIDRTNSIWGGDNDGIYVLQDDGILQIRPDGTLRRHRMMKYPDFWYCARTDSGLVYFLDDDGIWYFDEDKTIKKMPIDVKSPECFYEARDGRYWIGSQSGGIYIHDPSTGYTDNLTVSDGLPDNTTRSITSDGGGNIWVSSRCEVYKVDPVTKEVTLYGNPENMNLSYNTNSCAVTDGGYVLLGSKDHIAAFTSGKDTPENNLQVRLDALVINGEPMTEVPEEIVLRHDGNAISFYYSAMNYDLGTKLSYRYMLEGYNDGWVYVGTSTRVNFSGLKRGRYNLKVSVQNATGHWSDDVLSCGFKVKPSPWFSVSALIVYVIVSVIVIMIIISLQMKLRANKFRIESAEHEKVLTKAITKEKTDFFTNISHEYRTPLSLIYGPIKELSSSNSLDEHDRYLVSLVLQNTERMLKLTEQVLNFYSHDKEDLKIMKSDVSVFLNSMLNSFEYMFRQKELTLLVQIPDGIKAYCDREKVERIFFNIISNAVKYTPEGGEISVKAGVADGNLTVSVADTGIGISPDNIRKIFDRFERAGLETDKTNASGFGIGLNYAMHLAILHKGVLTVSPNEPKGSVFTISLPSSKNAYDPEVLILDTEASNENAIMSPETEAGAKENTVLVAEDNVELAHYIRHILLPDYNVILASNGNEALECVKVSAPDIIVSDIMMPFKDGYQLCREIKSDPGYCHLPVVLLTAKADMDSRIAGLETGADAYLKKPFDPVHLTTVIRGILENRRRMQAVLAENVSASDVVEKIPELNKHDRKFVEKLMAMMEEHISDEEFNVTAMSKEFGMSRTSLFSKIKALYGTSPQIWITDFRLNRAKELLETREFNVSEVSYKVGFATLTGFSRSFKNKFGIPPSAV